MTVHAETIRKSETLIVLSNHKMHDRTMFTMLFAHNCTSHNSIHFLCNLYYKSNRHIVFSSSNLTSKTLRQSIRKPNVLGVETHNSIPQWKANFPLL